MLHEKILIVDDEPTNLEFFEIMLSKLGFLVETATNGKEALEKVVQCNPDLILLDNIMPQMTGWEMTKILKQEKSFLKYSSVPIIMFSAMDDVQTKIEGYELGIEDYITKPFNFMEVFARIKAVLRSRHLSEQLLNREKRITVTESLKNNLLYFTRHVRRPTEALLQMANNLDLNNSTEVSTFLTTVLQDAKETIAAIEGLEEEVRELEGKANKLKEKDLSLEALEEKFQKYYQGAVLNSSRASMSDQ